MIFTRACRHAHRYKHLHGKFVVHPMDGRKVPIIQDAELVDMNFGTGAVKITPAHDPNDYATGKRHNLQCINILDDDGRMNANGGQFAGQPRFTVSSLNPGVTRCATCFFPSMMLDRLRTDNALAVSVLQHSAHSLSQQTMTGESTRCWAPTVASDVSSRVSLSSC